MLKGLSNFGFFLLVSLPALAKPVVTYPECQRYLAQLNEIAEEDQEQLVKIRDDYAEIARQLRKLAQKNLRWAERMKWAAGPKGLDRYKSQHPFGRKLLMFTVSLPLFPQIFQTIATMKLVIRRDFPDDELPEMPDSTEDDLMKLREGMAAFDAWRAALVNLAERAETLSDQAAAKLESLHDRNQLLSGPD